MSKVDPIQAVIDIGSSQTRVSIALCENGTDFKIIGCGAVNTPSMQNGIITDIAAAADAVRAAKAEAERQSGFEIRNVDASVGGQQTSGINSVADCFIHTGRITEEDITNLIIQARSRMESEKYRQLHVLERGFTVDEHDGIVDPAGMMADKLAADFYIIRAQKNSTENLRKTIDAAGVGINALISASLASSVAATSAEERELGVCLLDIGAGTVDFMVWEQNYPRCSGGINVGGEDISSYLANKFTTTRNFADMLKCYQGAVDISLIKSDSIELPSTGHLPPRQISSSDFADTLAELYMAIFQEFQSELHHQGMSKKAMQKCIKGGFVLTGAAAQIPGLAAYIQEKFDKPVRIAKPEQVYGLPENLQYDAGMMTSLGMLKLLYEESIIADHIWAKPPKQRIITKFKQIWTQRTR